MKRIFADFFCAAIAIPVREYRSVEGNAPRVTPHPVRDASLTVASCLAMTRRCARVAAFSTGRCIPDGMPCFITAFIHFIFFIPAGLQIRQDGLQIRQDGLQIRQDGGMDYLNQIFLTMISE
jgi:hypothetical protein